MTAEKSSNQNETKNEELANEEPRNPAPDGGYAWVVLIGSFVSLKKKTHIILLSYLIFF